MAFSFFFPHHLSPTSTLFNSLRPFPITQKKNNQHMKKEVLVRIKASLKYFLNSNKVENKSWWDVQCTVAYGVFIFFKTSPCRLFTFTPVHCLRAYFAVVHTYAYPQLLFTLITAIYTPPHLPLICLFHLYAQPKVRVITQEFGGICCFVGTYSAVFRVARFMCDAQLCAITFALNWIYKCNVLTSGPSIETIIIVERDFNRIFVEKLGYWIW